MPRAFDMELEQLWRERLQEFKRSGLSVREFCRAEAVREHTLFYWRRELAKRDRSRRTARSQTKLSANQQRRRVNGESSSHAEPSRRTPAFVPVQLVSEPLSPACMEFRFATCLVRMPTTIDERALRQAIRVVREEAAGC